MIFTGCVLNVVFLELLTEADPGCGHVVTLLQFSVIALDGLLRHWQWPCGGLAPRTVPLPYYLGLTLIFFVSSIVNNKVLDYNISIPMHTVFRSSSLVVSIIIGFVFFKKRYSKGEVFACLFITTGILMATFAEHAIYTSQQAVCCSDGAVDLNKIATADAAEEETVSNLMIGIALLTFGLVCMGFLGNLQELAYNKFGKASWRESMFYSHILALPAFVFVLPDVLERLSTYSTLDPVFVGRLPTVVNTALPFELDSPDLYLSVFTLLFLNTASVFVCIMGVFTLTSAEGTLTTTLTITTRKFVSLILSVFYFDNAFTTNHWIGTVLVFVGILMYTRAKQAKKAVVETTDSKPGLTPKLKQN
jgi:UDP-xylose/UDP-N-acetylglucosamine transporter B4